MWGNNYTEHFPCSKISIIRIIWRFKKKLKIIKRCNAERLNIGVFRRCRIFWDTTRIAYIKNKIHQSMCDHGWPIGLSDRRLLQGSVVLAQFRVTLFSFFNFILVLFLLELFTSNVNIYQFKAFFDKLQYMLKYVKRPL